MRIIITLALLGVLFAGCVSDSEPTQVDFEPLASEPGGWSLPKLIQESTGREMSLAMDPNDDLRMLACSPTGTGVVGPGENHSDFWLTTDGGGNWTRMLVEAGGEPPDLRDYTNEGGDCDVEIGPDGKLWTVDSWLGSLAVSWSMDGENWDGNGYSALVPVSDRPWIRADGSGRLHMTYQDVQALNPSAIWYTSTTDGDAWSVPTSVATATPGGAFTWTGDFVVSEDGGHLWSIYTRRAVPVTSDLEGSGAEQVFIAHSAGGTLWTSTLLSQRGGPSSFLYPSLDMDAEGGLHATWSELRANDQPTFYSYASDAQTWTEPVAIAEGHRTGAPWIAAGTNGTATILFSGSPDPAGDEQPWWFYVADLAAGEVLSLQTTTEDPIWVGPQASFPEFNEIMLDSKGQPHIAAVAPCENEDAFVVWCPYYQGRK